MYTTADFVQQCGVGPKLTARSIPTLWTLLPGTFCFHMCNDRTVLPCMLVSATLETRKTLALTVHSIHAYATRSLTLERRFCSNSFAKHVWQLPVRLTSPFGHHTCVHSESKTLFEFRFDDRITGHLAYATSACSEAI